MPTYRATEVDCAPYPPRLIEARYIREVKGLGLVLGTKMIQLGNRAQKDMPLKEIAHPLLCELAEETKDTVHLGIKDEDHIFISIKFLVNEQ